MICLSFFEKKQTWKGKVSMFEQDSSKIFLQVYLHEEPSINDVGIFQGVGMSPIPMLQGIRRYKLGKPGSKFRHGGMG